MNNVLYLKDIVRENKNDNRNSKKSYGDISKFIEEKENLKKELKINEIMEDIFSLKNNRPLIDLLNSIYEDELSEKSKIIYINSKDIVNNNELFFFNNIICDLRILISDGDRKFNYQIKFETEDEENISIKIFKYTIRTNSNNINDYNLGNITNLIQVNLPKPYVIMLNANKEVSEEYELKVGFEDKSLNYKFNALKSWKYDLRQLFEKNMYLLLPLKIVDLKKRLVIIQEQIEMLDDKNRRAVLQKNKLNNLIQDDILQFFRSMNLYFTKSKNNGLLTDNDINELNSIAIKLLKFLNKDLKFIFKSREQKIEETLKDMYL